MPLPGTVTTDPVMLVFSAEVPDPLPEPGPALAAAFLVFLRRDVAGG